MVVHEKVVDEDGGKSQQIDIYYKYVGDVNLKKAYTPERTVRGRHGRCRC